MRENLLQDSVIPMVKLAFCQATLNVILIDSVSYITSCMHLMSHSRDFMNVVKEFLWNEEQFVLSFLQNSRRHYDHFLFPKQTLTPDKKCLSDASVKHTVAGFVEEVI